MSIDALPAPADGRIVVAGDWHGNTLHAMTAIAEAGRLGIDTVLHVGDLAVLWPGDAGASFTFKLQRELDKHGVRLYLVDGNHDNHTALRALPRDNAGLGVVRTKTKGGGQLDLIRWVPRGHRWTWPGAGGRVVRFGALGGAYSIDWRYRKAGLTWWPIDEEVAPEDLEQLGTEPLDVLISHDCPTGAVPNSTMRIPIGDEAQSKVSRDLLRQAVDATRPALQFCGHWHQRRIFQVDHSEGPPTAVHVLDMDGTSLNWVVLDLDAVEVHAPAGGHRG